MIYTYTMYSKHKYFAAAFFFRGGNKAQERKGILGYFCICNSMLILFEWMKGFYLNLLTPNSKEVYKCWILLELEFHDILRTEKKKNT